MNNIIQTSFSRYILLLVLFALTGCSTIDSYRTNPNQTSGGLPSIPEIKRQQVTKPSYVAPKKTVVLSPTSVEAQYPKKLIQSSKKTPLTKQQQLEKQQRLQLLAKQNATVNIDPYASIPESSSSNKSLTITSTVSKPVPLTRITSPAVKSLMTSARADIALGKGRSAISKLERGLRIEPENAQAWHMLAKAHYSNSAFLHSISIAKKSNALSDSDILIAENWKLIKLAGERSGNASAIKEALDYMKVNP